MTCNNCGKPNKPGMKFCNTCGTPTPKSELDKFQNAPPAHVFEISGVKFENSDEDKASLTIGPIILDAIILLKGLAAVLLIVFFLPLFRVVVPAAQHVVITFVRRSYSLTGFNAAFGWEAGGGTVFAYFVFATPILIFAVLQFRKEIAKFLPFLHGKFFMVVLGLIVFGFVSLIMALINTRGPLFTVWPSWGFFFSFILYVLTGMLVVGCIIASYKK